VQQKNTRGGKAHLGSIIVDHNPTELAIKATPHQLRYLVCVKTTIGGKGTTSPLCSKKPPVVEKAHLGSIIVDQHPTIPPVK